MARGQNYLASIDEVRKWLAHTKLEHFIYLLLDNGYDDLDAIARATELELSHLEDLFQKPTNKQSIRFLAAKLKEIGVVEYRIKGLPPAPDFDAELAAAAAAAAAAAQPPAIPPASPRSADVPDKFELQPSHSHKGYLSMSVGDAEQVDKYCVFADGALMWYKTKRGGDPEGQIQQSDVVSLSWVSDTALILRTKQAVYHFSTDEEEMRDWRPIFKHLEAVGLRSAKKVAPAVPAPSSDSQSSAEPSAPASPPPSSPSSAPAKPPRPAGPPPPARISSSPKDDDDDDDSDRKRSTSPSHTRKETFVEKRARHFEVLLQEGAVFKKYKHKSSQKRMVWCTAALDKIIWGDEKKKEIKGFLRISDLLEINKGNGKNKLKIYLVSISRTLELEAKDNFMQNEWLTAFRYLIKRQTEVEEEMASKRQDPKFVTEIQKFRKIYSDLLKEGDLFQKYKGSSCTVRWCWFTPDLDRIQWGEEKLKVKGFILLEDMVEVEEGARHTFTIVAAKRNLDLEAKSEEQRRKWVEALRFFIRYGDKINTFVTQ